MQNKDKAKPNKKKGFDPKPKTVLPSTIGSTANEKPWPMEVSLTIREQSVSGVVAEADYVFLARCFSADVSLKTWRDAPEETLTEDEETARMMTAFSYKLAQDMAFAKRFTWLIYSCFGETLPAGAIKRIDDTYKSNLSVLEHIKFYLAVLSAPQGGSVDSLFDEANIQSEESLLACFAEIRAATEEGMANVKN